MDSFINVVGNLTRDPEIKFSDSGVQITKFGLAVTRKPKNGDEQTSFYNVVAFNSLAENVAGSLTKGNRVVVTGRLEVRTYSKNDGTEGTAVDIVAEEVAPSLRFATASIAKNAIRNGNGGGRSYESSDEPF
jgi:single-strand DNA-binding protein